MAFYWSLSSPLVLVFFLGFIHFWPCTAAAGKLHCVARLITKVVKCLKKCLISPSYFLFRVITITFWYSQQRSQKYRFEPKQHKVNMLPIGLTRLVVKYKPLWCKFPLWKTGSVNPFKNRHATLIVDEFCGDLKLPYISSNNALTRYESRHALRS